MFISSQPCKKIFHLVWEMQMAFKIKAPKNGRTVRILVNYGKSVRKPKMNEQDFDREENNVRKKNKVTKFREYFDDDNNKKHYKRKKQNRKPKRKKPQDNDW